MRSLIFPVYSLFKCLLLCEGVQGRKIHWERGGAEEEKRGKESVGWGSNKVRRRLRSACLNEEIAKDMLA